MLQCDIGVQLDAVQATRARYWVLDDESFTMQESLDITTSMETAREMSQTDAAAITGEGGLLGLGGQMTADMNNKCLFHKRLREKSPHLRHPGIGPDKRGGSRTDAAHKPHEARTLNFE